MKLKGSKYSVSTKRVFYMRENIIEKGQKLVNMIDDKEFALIPSILKQVIRKFLPRKSRVT